MKVKNRGWVKQQSQIQQRIETTSLKQDKAQQLVHGWFMHCPGIAGTTHSNDLDTPLLPHESCPSEVAQTENHVYGNRPDTALPEVPKTAFSQPEIDPYTALPSLCYGGA